jgi:hypothetical protein
MRRANLPQRNVNAYLRVVNIGYTSNKWRNEGVVEDIFDLGSLGRTVLSFTHRNPAKDYLLHHRYEAVWASDPIWIL